MTPSSLSWVTNFFLSATCICSRATNSSCAFLLSAFCTRLVVVLPPLVTLLIEVDISLDRLLKLTPPLPLLLALLGIMPPRFFTASAMPSVFAPSINFLACSGVSTISPLATLPIKSCGSKTCPVLPNVPSSLVGTGTGTGGGGKGGSTIFSARIALTFIKSAEKFATVSATFRPPLIAAAASSSPVVIPFESNGIFFKFSSYFDLVLVGDLLSPPAAADCFRSCLYDSVISFAESPGLTPCVMSFASAIACLLASPVINGVRTTRFAAAFISANLFCTAIIALVAPLRACCSS